MSLACPCPAPHRLASWTLACVCAPLGLTVQAQSAGAYQFDASLFRAGTISAQALARFNQPDAVHPGTYVLDVYVNGRYVSRMDIRFAVDAIDRVQPCLSHALWRKFGVAPESIRAPTEGPSEPAALTSTTPTVCTDPAEHVPGASARLDMARLRLHISVPQRYMQRTARGQVNPADLDAGSSMVFVNYIGNLHYVSWQDPRMSDQESGFLGVSGGVNLGQWQYRHQGNWSKTRGQLATWTNIRSYVQRPIPQLESQLTLGQNTTNGRFFSGLSYIGLGLSTDVRMRADSKRGYAPTVQGVAQSNAQVTVSQNAQVIYQTTVPPGPFVIDDLYPTAYNGDLTVQVREADGTLHTFSLPFSAVPESLRPGASRYQFALGRTRNDDTANSLFADISVERGLTNSMTANAGLRVADRYQAVVAGGVHASHFGALGVNLTYTRARLPDVGIRDGWMASLSYSRSFQPTGTHVSMAGYRYSTHGYRDLTDVLGVRGAAKAARAAGTDPGQQWQSASYRQRARVEASVNQSLGDYGNLSLSGSAQLYRDGRAPDVQWQLGYNMAWANGVSLNLSWVRQRTQSDGDLGRSKTEQVVMLSLGVPLGQVLNSAARSPAANMQLGYGVSYSREGGQHQSTLSGSFGENRNIHYSLGVSRSASSDQTIWNASLSTPLEGIRLGVSASGGPGYWQTSGNAQGALVLHTGGVTFGRYLSDTFALVYAPGAAGARLPNAQGARIDRKGYALVPALTPYRYNTLLLDPQGMTQEVELEDGEQRVAPYAGAALRVTFRTRNGQPLLIHARLPGNATLPLGTDAYDAAAVQDNPSATPIGMVGQQNLLYVRVAAPQGVLLLRWGASPAEQCRLPYDSRSVTNLSQKTAVSNAALLRLEADCHVG